jgi:hypothetical protein
MEAIKPERKFQCDITLLALLDFCLITTADNTKTAKRKSRTQTGNSP